jgi:ankyrin repeat protein
MKSSTRFPDGDSMFETLGDLQSKELLALCRAGKLYEIEEWIDAEKTIRVLPKFKKTPLEVAVEAGFHSLARLLVSHELCQSVKDAALAHAVESRQREIVELLLQHGADVKGVPFSDVLLTWDPALIRLFLNRGADVLADHPFAIAFGGKIRTALRPFVEYRKLHPELSKELQGQVDRALRYFAREGDLKWVSLLIWAGGDPRNSGPRLYDRDDPDLDGTAMEDAASSGRLEVLKRLKPVPGRDDLFELLNWAAFGPHVDTIRYLLDLGAQPNNKPNRASATLDRCLWNFQFESIRWAHSGHKISKWHIGRSLDSIRVLAEHGAVWRPDGPYEMNSVRRLLLGCEPDVTIEFLKILTEQKACSEDSLRQLFMSPRMREHVSDQHWWLARLKLREIVANPSGLKRKPAKITMANVSRGLLSRYNREELYEKTWSKPMQLLAKEYGISDVGLAKVCRKLAIPVPGRGYWAKKAAGKPVPKRPQLKALPET